MCGNGHNTSLTELLRSCRGFARGKRNENWSTDARLIGHPLSATSEDVVLQTTIVGSLPKPVWLAEPNALFAPWRLEGEALREGQGDAVRLALADQEEAGLDI